MEQNWHFLSPVVVVASTVEPVHVVTCVIQPPPLLQPHTRGGGGGGPKISTCQHIVNNQPTCLTATFPFTLDTSQLDHKVANCITRELVRYSNGTRTRPFAFFPIEGAWLHLTIYYTHWFCQVPVVNCAAQDATGWIKEEGPD